MTLMTRERAQRVPRAAAFGAAPFVPDDRIDSLRAMVDAGLSGRMLQKWYVVASRSPSYAVKGPVDPWALYADYGSTPEEAAQDAAKVAIIESDFMTAADLALRYRVETGPDRDAYAAKVAEILAAWASIQAWSDSSGSALTWQECWPLLLQSALMIRESPHYTAVLHQAMRTKTRAMMPVLNRINGNVGAPSSAMNNWAAVGTNALMACAVFLQDRAMFDAACYRWRQQFNDSVKSGFLGVDGKIHDNVQHLEVYRQAGGFGDGSYGLLYCNHDFAAKISAAEWARLNGAWLFDHVAPDGSSLRGLFDVIVTLNRYPDPEHHWFNTSNPPSRFYSNQIYAGFDVAHALWGIGNPDSEWLVENRGLGPTSGTTGVWTDADHDFMRNTELLYRGRPLIG